MRNEYPFRDIGLSDTSPEKILQQNKFVENNLENYARIVKAFVDECDKENRDFGLIDIANYLGLNDLDANFILMKLYDKQYLIIHSKEDLNSEENITEQIDSLVDTE